MFSKIIAAGFLAVAMAQHDHGPGSSHGPHDHSPGASPGARVGGITKSGKTYFVNWARSATPLPGIHAGIGEYVIFEYDKTCDIYAFSNVQAFNACDFGPSSAKLVAGPSIGGGIGGMNKFEAPLNSEGLLYLGCSVGNACSVGNMKVMLHIQDGEMGHLHGPGGAHDMPAEPAGGHDHNAPGHQPHGPMEQEHDHNAPGHQPHDHAAAVAAAAPQAPREFREPSLDRMTCTNADSMQWTYSGPGYCRERSCESCMGTLSFKSFCVSSQLACMAECEATESCQGISYIERVNHEDGDRCQANGLGRCLLYSGNVAVGGSQFGSRQEYSCMAYSASSAPKAAAAVEADDVPTAVRMLSIAKNTKTAIDLVWAAPMKNFNHGVDTYKVEVMQGKKTTPVQMADVTDSTAKVQGLKPKTLYQFKVTAVNSLGNSEVTRVKGRTRK